MKELFGLYSPKKKKIILNEDYVRECLNIGKTRLDDLYATLTHEVYHALSKDENGKDRLGSINRYNGKYNKTLLESIIETAADRTVFSRTEEDKYNFRKETNGYPEMTFVVPALAATYGVSEREFLRHAIMGRENLVRFLSSNAKEVPERTASFLDGIELNLYKMHDALYSKRGKRFSVEKRRGLISESIFAISYICNSKLEERYGIEQLTDSCSVYNFVENAKYNHVKLHKILDIEMDNLNWAYGIDVVPVITEMKEESDYDERKTIIDMDKVVSRRQNFESEAEYLRVFNYARKGMLDNLDPQYIAQKGISHTRGLKYYSQIDQRVIRKFDNDDFQINSPWNNYGVEYYISKYIPHLIPRRDFIKFAKDKIEQLMYRNRSFLSEQTTQVQENIPDYFKLSEEELAKFNINIKQFLKESRAQNTKMNPVEKDKEE